MPPERRVRAADTPPRAVIWAWRDRIPAHFLTLIAGRPGTGKSFFTAYLAADFSRRGHNVIISAMENPRAHVTVPRLIAANANLDLIDLQRFVFPADLRRLEETIVRDNVKLVILDPFTTHLMGVSRRNDSIRQVTTPLQDIADRTGCAIIVIEHVLKSVGPKTHPLYAIPGGSSGIIAAAQMVYLIGPDPEDSERVYLCSVKNNLCDKPPAAEFMLDSCDTDVGDIGAMTYVKDATFDARKLLVTPSEDDHKPPTKIAAACEWLTNYLALAPRHTALAKDLREDAKQFGHSKNTLDRAAVDMGIVKSAKGGRYTTWTLPPEVVDAMDDSDGTDF